MLGLSVSPKLVGESRLEVLDVSSVLGPVDVLASATIAAAVYTGTDPTPAAIFGAPTTDPIYNQVTIPFNAVGVAGVIYQAVVTITLVSGSKKTVAFFLVVMPDAV